MKKVYGYTIRREHIPAMKEDPRVSGEQLGWRGMKVRAVATDPARKWPYAYAVRVGDWARFLKEAANA